MTSGKLSVRAGAFALAACLACNAAWSTRLVGSVTGQVTATPLEGVIEIDHRVYHIAANSPAEKSVLEISAGADVDVVMDGPADSKASHVVSIKRHAGT
jgi:hypothetical protein